MGAHPFKFIICNLQESKFFSNQMLLLSRLFSHMLPILLSSNRDFNRDRAPIWRNMNLAFKRRKPCVSSRHCFSVGMLQFVPEPSRLFWCELDHHNLPFTHMLFNPICILFLASFLFTQILMISHVKFAYNKLQIFKKGVLLCSDHVLP